MRIGKVTNNIFHPQNFPCIDKNSTKFYITLNYKGEVMSFFYLGKETGRMKNMLWIQKGMNYFYISMANIMEIVIYF